MLQRTLQQAIEDSADALGEASLYFGHGTDNPWDEAVQLVLFAAGLPLDADRSHLLDELNTEQEAALAELIEQRIEYLVPMPYLTGRTVFAGVELKVDERALIPRSPIAELIEQHFQPWWLVPERRVQALDLCCGGGCIGIGIASHIPQAQVDLVDINAKALALAKENVALCGVGSQVRVVESDLFKGLGDKRYDLIVSNPPYVDAHDMAQLPREYQHEPREALAAGEDGLSIVRRLMAEVADYLLGGGLLVVEVGNSWQALEQAYPEVPFTWVEFERGGHGVFVMSAGELASYRDVFSAALKA